MMNRLFISFFAILACALAIGCGGGGTNPTNAFIAPQIVSIAPTSGGPGTIVQIQGSGFGNVQGASTLSYAGVTIIPNSWSDTLITATIPSNAASDGPFVINVNGRVSNPSTIFTLGDPTIYSINPTSGNPGSLVTIYGANFGTRNDDSRVTFNSQTATISLWQANQITCIVPTSLTVSGSGDVYVVVYANSRQSNTVSFNVTIPTITSINPTIDNVGAVITISGSGFGAVQQQSIVTIGGTPASIVRWFDTFIQARIPTGVTAGANSVMVTVNGRSSTPSTVTIAAPIVNTQSAIAVKGQLLTLNGLHFGITQNEGNGTITVQGAGIVPHVLWSDTAISFIWPIDNVIGTQQVPVTITVGGLSTTVLINAE